MTLLEKLQSLSPEDKEAFIKALVAKGNEKKAPHEGNHSIWKKYNIAHPKIDICNTCGKEEINSIIITKDGTKEPDPIPISHAILSTSWICDQCYHNLIKMDKEEIIARCLRSLTVVTGLLETRLKKEQKLREDLGIVENM